MESIFIFAQTGAGSFQRKNFLLVLEYKSFGLRSYFSGGGCFSLSVPRTSASISERSIFFSLMAFCVGKKN